MFSRETILAGFSYGAMTVFIAAASREPSELWLFSLSPYFIEDTQSESFNQAWLKHIGHRRVDSFKKLSFISLTKSITAKTFYFYGDLELKKWSDIDYRNSLVKMLPNASTVIAIGAEHDVASDAYIAAIKKVI